MAHARTQIRNAVVAALTGLATTGARVHASRMRPTELCSTPRAPRASRTRSEASPGATPSAPRNQL